MSEGMLSGKISDWLHAAAVYRRVAEGAPEEDFIRAEAGQLERFLFSPAGMAGKELLLASGRVVFLARIGEGDSAEDYLLAGNGLVERAAYSRDDLSVSAHTAVTAAVKHGHMSPHRVLLTIIEDLDRIANRV